MIYLHEEYYYGWNNYMRNIDSDSLVNDKYWYWWSQYIQYFTHDDLRHEEHN
jgi:hypothetical protein